MTSWLQLHLIVLIYGFTAILGKLIQLPALELVWYRMLLTVVTFWIYMHFKGIRYRVRGKDLLALLGVGAIVALHWITFYGAIKLSNVSVTLGTFATTTLFISFMEPLFYRKKVNPLEVVVGLIIILGLYLIFRFEMHYALGIGVALISSFLAALFTLLNKKLVATRDALQISFYEMVGGTLAITVYLLITGTGTTHSLLLPGSMDWFYLILLSTVCTAFAHTVQVVVMKHLSAFAVTLTINLEPVYGIILAYLFFGEDEKMTLGFYLGTFIILLAVFGYPMISKRFEGKSV